MLTPEIILQFLTLVIVIIILVKVMKPEYRHKKHTVASNKICPISGEAVNHPGGEPIEVELPNGNKLMVCSKDCKKKVSNLFTTYGDE